MGDHNTALVVVGNGDLNGINRIVVGVAVQLMIHCALRNNFLNGVGIGLACICLGVLQRLEAESAVSSVGDLLDEIVLRIVQTEGEFSCFDLSAETGEGLGTVESQLCIAIEDVDILKGNGVAGRAGAGGDLHAGNFQLAFLIVGDSDHHGVDFLGVLDEAQNLIDLGNGEGVVAGLVKGDLIEGDCAILIVLLGLEDLGAVDIAFQGKGEVVTLQTLFIDLGSLEDVLGRLSLIGIIEYNVGKGTAVDGIGSIRIALAIIHHIHGNREDTGVIGDTLVLIVHSLCGNDLLDGVGIGLAQIVCIIGQSLQFAEAEAAVSSNRSLCDHSGAIKQTNLEFTGNNATTGQILGAGENHMVMAVDAVLVGKGDGCVGTVDGVADSDAALAVIGNGDNHFVNGGIVGDALVVSNLLAANLGQDLADLVGKGLAHMGLIVAQCREGELAFRVVLHFFNQLALAIEQTEAECVGFQSLVHQLLGAFQYQLTVAVDGVIVIEGDGLHLGSYLLTCIIGSNLGDGGGGDQSALMVIHHADVDLILGLIVGHAAGCTLGFFDHVVVIAGFVKVDSREDDVAVSIVLHRFGVALGCGEVAFGFGEGETELTINHHSAGQLLGAGEICMGGQRYIGVGKHQVGAGDHFTGCHQLAVAGIGNGYLYYRQLVGVGHTVNGGTCALFGDGVVEFAGGSIGNSLKSKACALVAVIIGVVGRSAGHAAGNNGSTGGIGNFHQIEAELTIEHGLTGEGLAAFDDDLGVSSVIAVAEGGGLGGGIFVVVICLQNAVFFRDHDHHIVDGLVIGHAAQAALCFHHVESIDAHLVEGQVLVKFHVSGSIVGAGCQSGSTVAVSIDVEGELAGNQAAAFQMLHNGGNDIQIHGNIRRIKGVGKGDGCSVAGLHHSLAGGEGAVSCGHTLMDGKVSGDAFRTVGAQGSGENHGDQVMGVIVDPAGETVISLLDDEVIGLGGLAVCKVTVIVVTGQTDFALGIGGSRTDQAAQRPNALCHGSIVAFHHEALAGLAGIRVIYDSFNDIDIGSGGVVLVIEYGGNGPAAVGCLGSAEVSFIARLHIGYDLSFQLAAVVGNHNGEGVDGAVVGDIGIGAHVLQDLAGVCAFLGKLQFQSIKVKGFGSVLGAGRNGDAGGIHICPRAVHVLLQTEGEHSILGHLLGIKVLGAIKVHIQLGGCGCILVGNGNRSAHILMDGDRTVCLFRSAGIITGLYGVGEVGLLLGRQTLGDGDHSSLGQAQDLGGLGVLEGQAEAAFVIHRYGGSNVLGGIGHIRHLDGQFLTGQGSTHIHQNLEGLRLDGVGNIVLAGNTLGDIQIAVALGSVHKLRALDSLSSSCDLGRSAGNGCAVDGHSAYPVILVVLFGDGVGNAVGKTNDVHSFAGSQSHLCLTLSKGHILTGSFLAVGIQTDHGSGAAAAFQHEGEAVGCAVHSLIQSLGQPDTGGRGHGKLTVVTQHIVGIVMAGSIVMDDGGILGVSMGIGIVGGFGLLEGVPEAEHSTLGDDPVTAGLFSGSQRFSRDLLVMGVHTVGTGLQLFINLVGTVVSTGSAGRGSAGVHGAVVIGIDDGIFCIVVPLVLQRGLEVAVSISGGVGDAVFLLPLVGVEDIAGILVDSAVPITVQHLLGDVPFGDSLPQGNFIQQTDGLDVGIFQLQVGHTGDLTGSIGLGLNHIGNGGNQGSGDLPGDHGLAHNTVVVKVLQLLGNTDGGIHHIGGGDAMGSIGIAQHDVGLDHMGSAGRGSGGDAFVPEVQIIAVGIGVPADVIAEFGVAGVTELAVGIGVLQQLTGNSYIADAQTLLNGPNQVIAQVGRVVHGAEDAAIFKAAGQQGAGEQGIANHHAMHVRHVHVGADLIGKGDIAVVVVILFHEGGIVLGLKDDLIHDRLKRIDHFLGRVGGEIFIHIYHLIDQRVLADGGGMVDILIIGIGQIGQVHCAGAQCQICIPIILDVVVAVGRIQHTGIIITAGVQAQRIELGGSHIVLFHLCAGPGSSQLGQEGNAGSGRLAGTGGRSTHRGTGAGIQMCCGGGRAVGHQHHNGHTGSAGLDGAVCDHGICVFKLLPGLVQTVLNISTAQSNLAGIGNGCARLSLQTILDGSGDGRGICSRANILPPVALLLLV